MAGRPSARTFIVSPDEIMSIEDIGREVYRMQDLWVALTGQEECLKWLAKRRLIKNATVCGRCGEAARLNRLGLGFRLRFELSFIFLF
jgi:hypothetical protein